ncbi:hypothetical protein BGX24_006263, partial [Mortierella sp. AD032]
LRGGFRWTLRDREALVEFLQGRQLDARLCPTEADVATAADCQPQDIALTQDSDFFAYDSVKTIWRPVGKWGEVKVLEYSGAAVLAQIGLSTTKLTALACVSSNDYNKNIPSTGIATNYRIIKDLPDAGVSRESTYGLQQSGRHRLYGVYSRVYYHDPRDAVTADVSSVPLPSLQSTTPLMASPASSLSYELLCQQYKAVKDQHFKAKEQRRLNITRQYQRKPYTAEQETRYQQSVTEAKARKAEKQQQREARRLEKAKKLAKKPPPKIDDMNKSQLVNAMVYEHPIVALPVGTVKANSKRAATAATTNANRLPSSEQQQRQQQQEVTDCILHIVGQVRMTKRHAQEFLGEFIETVFERDLTENDRTILNSLCPAVKSKIRVVPQPNQNSQASSSSSAGTPAEDEGEGDAEDDGMRMMTTRMMILLARFYTRKIKFKTVAERQVCQLLERATSLGITLPPVPPRTISCPTNGLLESTTKQLYQSIKTMYRNGSVALEKKVNTEADGQSGT